MMLQSLSRYYQRLVQRGAEGIAAYGYSPEKISYAIVLDTHGHVLDVDDVRDTTGKKPYPRLMTVPQPEKRTVGIKSNFLWDKTSYVLGVSATSKRTEQEHQAFCEFHEQALEGATDPGLLALLRFLRQWRPEQFCEPSFKDEMKDANVVFRLDGEHQYLHERAAAKAARERLFSPSSSDDAQASAPAICLVTGARSPIARLHPAIKGVMGAQSSGASIVSFNLDAFTSYGKHQGDNAPVSEQAAFAYTSALNYLLRRDVPHRQNLTVGDTTVLFWAEADDERQAGVAEMSFAAMLNPPDSDDSEALKIRGLLEGVAEGRPLSDFVPGLAEGTRMYVLGLAPNASRLSVRFWLVDTFGDLARRIAQHAQDLHIEPLPWRSAPSVWRLALATAPSRDGRAKNEDVPPQLAGELLRAILTGGRYPASLLASILMRMRADGDVSGVRISICKAVLSRNRPVRNSEEEVPVSLDKASKQPAYLLGRLFAVLEYIQRSALGGQVNATIRDRYYGAASATPASIFPVLLRNTQNHLGKLRKERPGQAINLERDVREIVAALPEQFPRSLHIEAQGRFAIGYYHQSQSYFTKRNGSADAVPETEIDTEGALS
ncbi:type I-C CRISPR-associated protein Cas8c/Csd1 [Solimonas marina]|uniref:Type I-C CRISPR-associated protein Cas8c/Csd1 n=1 Tax=Solimonas marina TaxID=2714601 RepID=A0A969W8I3_9GAMM|nr:type I-C CRISPR-associated protein Cas8c/Csd1 [Solimonas marina]NKF21490.1 type I-C CRISPR-associated protein Cas8c/Csd1 [Solimonas marina]